jgi:hypothetical protein
MSRGVASRFVAVTLGVLLVLAIVLLVISSVSDGAADAD